MARTSRVNLLGATLVAASAALSHPAAAQDAVRLDANAQAFRPEVAVLGDADDAARFDFHVALKMRHADELRARLTGGGQVSDAELEQRYLPTREDHAKVLAWLAAHRIDVVRTYGNRLTIEASGSVGAARQALGVPLRRVAAEGAEYVATDAAPVVPAAIAEVIEGFNGLQPYLHQHKMSHLLSPPAARRPGEVAATTISGNYYPGGVARAYRSLPFLSQDGAGTRTAIVIDTFPNASDLTQFWSLTGVPQKLSNIEFVQAVSGALPASSVEDTLDVEWASGIGYGSKVRVYAIKNLQLTSEDSGYQAVLSDIGKGVAIQQMSVSIGGCEVFVPRTEVITQNNLFSLLAAKNVSIFFASGDSGSRECGASNPAFPAWASTSPYVTAVGATHLVVNVNGQTVTIASETGWTGSGGGLSNLFGPPSYQASLGAPDRVVPDVAAVGDPATGVEIVLDGKQSEIGGTSASSPIWAGFASLINQARIAAKKKPLGMLNPRIYPLLGSTDFRDVVGGCNGDYCAVKGYDLVTGLGSPVMNNLLPKLVSQP